MTCWFTVKASVSNRGRVMDEPGWGHSQPSRPTVKRIWDHDDGILGPLSTTWNRTAPVESNLARSSSTLRTVDNGLRANSWSSTPTEHHFKRFKAAGDDVGISLVGANPPKPSLPKESSDISLTSHRIAMGSAMHTAPQSQLREWESANQELGPAASRYTSPSYGRSATRSDHLETDHLGHGEGVTKNIKEAEMLHVASNAAAQLTKALNTLTSGVSSFERVAIGREEGIGLLAEGQTEPPPIGPGNLQQTLDRILSTVYRVSEVADSLVQRVLSSQTQILAQSTSWQENGIRDGNRPNMKRHLDAGNDDEQRFGDRSGEDGLESKSYTRRKSGMSIPNPEELPSIRNPHDFHHFHSSVDGAGRRSSIMNPPPAPVRQLPSSPGRSLPSPTSVNFPSPSAASYGSSSQSINLPPPGLLAASNTPYLPSIASSQSDAALQAHTAALQHEVSVQKIALSSLQSEHDKLLAAFQRSQTRASALEKKHSVSDNEIVNLSEEKIRLQNQVTDLEKDVEDLTRSRDEARQTAVQEAAQYVEIVKKATQLEILAAEERKAWERLRTEMEEKIEALTNGHGRSEGSTLARGRADTQASLPDDALQTSTPSPDRPEVKLELASPHQSRTPRDLAGAGAGAVPNEALKLEVTRLRARCTEVEDTLRSVREESRSLENIVKALGVAGKSILDQADRTLDGIISAESSS